MEKKKSELWSLVALVLAALSIFAVAMHAKDYSLKDFKNYISNADPFWFAMAILCMACFIAFEGMALLGVLKAFGYKRSINKGIVYSAADIYFSAITPSATGGQPAAAFYMMADGVPAAVSAVALLLNLVMYTASIMTIGIIAIILRPGIFNDFTFLSKILIIIGYLILGTLIVFIILLIKREDWVHAIGALILKIMGKIKIIRNPQKFEKKLEETKTRLEAAAREAKLASETIDVTLPAKKLKRGYLHPNTQVRNQIVDIFGSMGFSVYEGNEIETDHYNFTALNIPQDHPSRDRQDTFYLSPEFLLRTQTSSGQIHVMENTKPPIKILSPGKVFRSDDDATHSPMFTQMEGLVVDKKITLCDLKGMLDVFVKKIYGEETTTRLRPSYFPFTEPSVEVDVSCFECGGKGCKLCKGTGWIEILGAGIVNKKVLENCGIDSDEYSGLAFGIGIERTAMLKYGINNIKLLFESDLNVLKQIDDN